MNYESALEYIHAVQWAGHKPGLTRTRTLLAALGDPHKQLRFIHVAGTNGKGSTAAMLASCLQAAGYRVGLYTSPFINRFNERIQVNGQQIPDEELVRLVERVKPAADAMADVPTEFEIITALGMLYFAERHCDIVVLEVGLGGTLDSTNVIDPPECAVITALGMDHVKELGPTIADIAAAKAGIIKPGSPVVSYGGVPEADAVIVRVAKERNAPLTVVDFDKLKFEGGDLDAVTFDFDGLGHGEGVAFLVAAGQNEGRRHHAGNDAGPGNTVHSHFQAKDADRVAHDVDDVHEHTDLHGNFGVAHTAEEGRARIVQRQKGVAQGRDL